MKLVLCLFVLSAPVSYATPTRVVEEREKYLGANEGAYAIIRVKLDNQGSHYVAQKTIYLDEYNKEDGSLKKSTVILEVDRGLDVERPEIDGKPNRTNKLLQQNKELTWGEVLYAYDSEIVEIDKVPEWVERLEVQDDGLYLDGERLELNWDQLSEKNDLKLPLEIDSKGELLPNQRQWRIRTATYDQNWLFLQLILENEMDEEGTRVEVVAIAPEQTRLIFDRAEMDAIYLKAGSYVTYQEANAEALSLLQTLKAKGGPAPAMEVWSSIKNGEEVSFVVVLTEAQKLIDDGKVEQYAELLGTTLVPIPSRGLQKKWEPMALEDLSEDAIERARSLLEDEIKLPSEQKETEVE